MKRWRIWSLWSDVSEDTGLVVIAPDEDGALARAVATGIVSGAGARNRYRGLHAQRV